MRLGTEEFLRRVYLFLWRWRFLVRWLFVTIIALLCLNFFAVSAYADWMKSKLKDLSCPPLVPVRPMMQRTDLAGTLQRLNFSSGIEVGVKEGEFAQHNLKNWPNCQKYYLVDIWMQQENYKDIANVNNRTHEAFFIKTKERLKPWEAKTEFYRMYSNEAAKQMSEANVQVDFVYIDARHDYCGCKEDMELFWPLVKPGGIMAGHDFEHNDGAPKRTGQDWSVCRDGSIHPEAVQGAVLEFSEKHNLPLGVTYREPIWNSWWFQKPYC